MVYAAMQAPLDDLFYLPDTHSDWKKLIPNYELVDKKNDH